MTSAEDEQEPPVIDRAEAARLGLEHPQHWMMAMWLVERITPDFRQQRAAVKGVRRPDFVLAKAKSYLDRISDPGGDAAAILTWRLEPGIGLHAALAWWIEGQTGLVGAKVVPATMLASASSGMLAAHGTLAAVHAELVKVVTAFATLRDDSFSQNEIRADIEENLRRENASTYRRVQALRRPDLVPELLIPLR